MIDRLKGSDHVEVKVPINKDQRVINFSFRLLFKLLLDIFEMKNEATRI